MYPNAKSLWYYKLLNIMKEFDLICILLMPYVKYNHLLGKFSTIFGVRKEGQLEMCCSELPKCMHFGELIKNFKC